jgi:hypothetical protein
MRPPCYPRSLLHRGRDTIRWAVHTPDHTRGGSYQLPCHLPRRHQSDEYNPLETPQTRIEATDLDPWSRQKARGTVLLDATGNVGIVVTRAPVPPRGTVRSYVRIVGAITTTKLRVPADIWDVDKCLAWSDEEVEQATVRLDIHTDGQRIRRLLWIPSAGGHTAGESSKATVTCTEFVSQKRRSIVLQQLTQQPESSTSSRKRAPHRSKDPAETPRNDPIVPKRSRPANSEQDPDLEESNVARPTERAGTALLLAAAAARDVDEPTDEMGTPETDDDAGSEMTAPCLCVTVESFSLLFFRRAFAFCARLFSHGKPIGVPSRFRSPKLMSFCGLHLGNYPKIIRQTTPFV